MSIPAVAPRCSTVDTVSRSNGARGLRVRRCCAGGSRDRAGTPGTSKTSATRIRRAGAQAAGSRGRPPGHAIAGHRNILMQFSEHFHSRGRKTDFLCGFPQGSLRGVRVSGLAAAAGKLICPAWSFEVRGTARKQNRKPALAPYQRHEHGGGPDFPITAPKVAGLPKSLARPFAPRQNASAPRVRQARRRVNSLTNAVSGAYSTRSSAQSRRDRNCIRPRGRYSIGRRNDLPAREFTTFSGEPMKIVLQHCFGALMLASASALAFTAPRT